MSSNHHISSTHPMPPSHHMSSTHHMSSSYHMSPTHNMSTTHYMSSAHHMSSTHHMSLIHHISATHHMSSSHHMPPTHHMSSTHHMSPTSFWMIPRDDWKRPPEWNTPPRTGTNMKRGWTKQEKWKNSGSVLFLYHCEPKHSYYWGKSTTTWAPGIEKGMPKASKASKTWKTYVHYEINWKAMNQVAFHPVQEMHVFRWKMSTFVKPTRTQEESTSKTHENT